jgi:splicing factor 3B subunit 3
LNNLNQFTESSEMHLYNLTLQKTTAITHCITGSFSGDSQEIILAKGKSLEIYKQEEQKLTLLLTEEVYGVIRSIIPFKIPGIFFLFIFY